MTQGFRVAPAGTADDPSPTLAITEPMRYERERAFYRVEYPIQERPELHLEGEDSAVLRVFDVSEHGLRFAPDPSLTIDLGDVLKGTIRFGRRAEQEVQGEVVWIRDRAAALRLRVPIPFGTILDEQRYLRSRYRNLLD